MNIIQKRFGLLEGVLYKIKERITMSANLKLETGVSINLVLTDDVEQIKKIAQIIVENSPSKYTPARVDAIKDVILARMNNVSNLNVEDVFLRSVYDYWAYGIKIEEEFYYGLLNKSHDERKKYITYMEHIIYAYKLNNKERKDLLYHKYKTYQFFKEFYKRDVILINGNADEYQKFRKFVTKHPNFVIKPIDAHLGDGVHKEIVDNVTEVSIREAFRRICSRCKVNKEKYNAKIAGAVLEEIFDQDERMSAFHSSGVNDIRCTTLRVDDKVHVFYPWLSTGRDERFLTPYADGRIVAGINVDTGIVETDGRTESGEVYKNHPNSGIKYKGFQIPEYDNLIETVTEAALRLTDITYIGFDMVLTKSGWAIQEANFAGEPIWQMLYGYGTKKEFEDIVGWHLSKEFWWQEEIEII